MRSIELKGLILDDVAPIIDQVLDLPDGVSVLYGKNGVGKTRILEGVRYAASPTGERPGSVSLVFKYPFANYSPDIAENVWRSPWVYLKNDHPSNEELNGLDLVDVWQEFVDHVRAQQKWERSNSNNLAFFIYSMNVMWESDEKIKSDLMNLCYQIVDQALFKVTYWENRIELGCIAPNSDSIQIWRSILKDAEANQAWEDQLSSKYGQGFAILLENYVAESRRSIYPWQGPVVYEIPVKQDYRPPVDLICENSEKLVDITRKFLVDLVKATQKSNGAEVGIFSEENLSLLLGDRGSYQINPVVLVAAEEISIRASKYFSKLMPDAPLLVCEVRDLSQWGINEPFEWVAKEKFRNVHEAESIIHNVPILNLSNAQKRWAEFAIKLSMIKSDDQRPLLMVLDEPEAGLHRKAERQLASGITQITKEFGAKCLLATHSPIFLNDKNNNLIHVNREDSGNTKIGTLPAELSDRLDDYGIDRSDLLQFVNKFVIVEGSHDVWVLEEMFGEEFQSAGVSVLALRGLAKLKLLSALDSQFLFRFTGAEIIIFFDNDKKLLVQDVWYRACQAKDRNENFISILEELKSIAQSFGKSQNEYLMIHDFCVQAINENSRGRVKFHGLSKGDIVDYFSPNAFISKSIAHLNFDELRKQYDREKVQGQDFKAWLQKTFGAKFSEKNFKEAVKQSDSIHPDFTSLLSLIQVGI